MLRPNWVGALRRADHRNAALISKLRRRCYAQFESVIADSFHNVTDENPNGNESTVNRLNGFAKSSLPVSLDPQQVRIRGDRNYPLSHEITDCQQAMYYAMVMAVDRLTGWKKKGDRIVRQMDDIKYAKKDVAVYIRNAIDKANRSYRRDYAPGAVYTLRPSSGLNAKRKKANEKRRAKGLPELSMAKPLHKKGQPGKLEAENGWNTWVANARADAVGVPHKEYTSTEAAERPIDLDVADLLMDVENSLLDIEPIDEGLRRQAIKLWWEGISIVDTAKVIGISEYRVRQLRKLIKERVATVLERKRAV